MGKTRRQGRKVNYIYRDVDCDVFQVHSLFYEQGNPVVHANKDEHIAAFGSTTYTTIEAVKESSDFSRDEWASWNSKLLDLIKIHKSLLVDENVCFSEITGLLQSISGGDHISSRFKSLETELCGGDADLKISAKSLFCMLRFLPFIDERGDNLYFSLDDETGWFGISLSENLHGFHGQRKTLDVIFKDDGEIYFTFIEGGQGFSRISGSSYLTDYLVNSPKFRKILNIFDY